MLNTLRLSLHMTIMVLLTILLLLPANRVQADVNEWTWMGGSNVVKQRGSYGDLGEPSDTNIPGARRESISWSDESGDLWLFGGLGHDTDNNTGSLNDLWRYDMSTGNWTWVGGSNLVDQSGSYGDLGEPAIPGGRQDGLSWTDEDGDFWLFGGYGRDGDGNDGRLNDLWRYDMSTGNWVWVSGSNVVNQRGSYGVLGEPSDTTIPGGRRDSISWTDESGNFWLFGGYGDDSDGGASADLNDLWRYDMSTGNWTWVSGSNVAKQRGSYGVLGEPSDTNIPGARRESISWVDESGDFWLFGGFGHDTDNNTGSLNDLWHYDMSTGNWTWVGGSNLVDQRGSYGVLGEPSDTNIPGGRRESLSWTDEDGDFWLFGGIGEDSAGTFGRLNDVWRYDMSTGNWVWVSGSNVVNQSGSYGVLGEPSDTNIPSARHSGISWADANGDFWLFGGFGTDGLDVRDVLNDLWLYELPECFIGGADCDNGLFCDGAEECFAYKCFGGVYQCPDSVCDEENKTCVECLVNEDCFGLGVCEDNICTECMVDADCDNGAFCDGIETCNAGACETSNIPCGSEYCNEANDTCRECFGDGDCFGGVCVDSVCFDCRGNVDCNSGVCENNICIACADDSDCDNGAFCDGMETCNAGTCETSDIPCASRFCDEAEDICLECTGDDDCFGWFCEENICVECLDETDCDNELFCDGAEICEAGACTAGSDPCMNEACDEFIDECVECRGDYDCADMYMCQSALCVPRCELTIKHKALRAEKLQKKAKKLSLSITGGFLFDPTGAIVTGRMERVQTKPNAKKGKLKVKLMIPKGTEPQTIPIQVGECMGEIEIQ